MTGLRDGAEVTLEGTITGIRREDTRLGTTVALELDGYEACAASDGVSGTVRGDPAADYRVGDRVRTTLRFESFRFNGDLGVWSRDLLCPFPGVLRAAAGVWDAVSLIAGMILVYNGTAADGWSSYEIATPTGGSFRLDVLPVTLRKSLPLVASATPWGPGANIDSAARWTEIASVQYLAVSGHYGAFPIVDDMTSLASPASRNGMLRFADADGDGFAGDGDRIEVLLDDPIGDTSVDSYMLQIGEAEGGMSSYVYGGRFILNEAGGPLEVLPSSRIDRTVQLLYTGHVAGATVATTIDVGRIQFGPPPAVLDMGFLLTVGTTILSGALADLPTTLPGGITLGFEDRGVYGRLTQGDRLTVGAVTNRSLISLQLIDRAAGNTSSATIQWVAGHGPLVGRFPEFALAARGAGPFTIDVTVPFWHPELGINGTARASLVVDSTEALQDVPLRDGTLGTFPGGSLSFLDADADGFLSDGDSFLLDEDPSSAYELVVEVLFGTVTRTALAGG